MIKLHKNFKKFKSVPFSYDKAAHFKKFKSVEFSFDITDLKILFVYFVLFEFNP